MRYYRDPYVILRSYDRNWAIGLGLVLIGLEYTDKLPSYISANLNYALGRSALYGMMRVADSYLANSAIEKAQKTVGYYKHTWATTARGGSNNQIQGVKDEVGTDDKANNDDDISVEEVKRDDEDSKKAKDKKGEEALYKLFCGVCAVLAGGVENCLVECSQAIIGPKDRAVVDSYLYLSVKNMVAGAVINYCLHDAPSTFMKALAVSGAQFATQMTQALLNCDQYVDNKGMDCNKLANFGCVLSNSFRKALSSAAVQLCVATIAIDQKQLISQAVMLPTLYCLIEPFSIIVLDYFICNSKLMDKPRCMEIN